MSATRPILIRTACSEAIGFGHLRRCVTLAQEIDVAVKFAIVADARGIAIARDLGIDFDVVDPQAPLPDALGVIVDDYAVTDFASLHPKLLLIDDLADREIHADVILNAAPSAAQLPYPPGPLHLFGPRYALLRREFRDLRARVVDNVSRVIVTFGGSDPAGRSGAIATRLAQVLPDAHVDVVVGPLAAREFPDDPRVVVHRSPRDMVQLMMRADLAIAAGGQTTYELAACGVPTVAVCIAENQRVNLAALAAVPTLRVATDDTVIDEAVALAADRTSRAQLAAAGQALFDGRGAERVWQALRARWLP